MIQSNHLKQEVTSEQYEELMKIRDYGLNWNKEQRERSQTNNKTEKGGKQNGNR